MASAISDGFKELAKELEAMSQKATSPKVSEKVLQAGADVVLERSRHVIAQGHFRSGMLYSSINSAYNAKNNEMDIGWGGDLDSGPSAHGFYGMFLDNGFVNAWSGKRVEVPHLKSTFESEKENVFKAMLEEYKKELGE